MRDLYSLDQLFDRQTLIPRACRSVFLLLFTLHICMLLREIIATPAEFRTDRCYGKKFLTDHLTDINNGLDTFNWLLHLRTVHR